MSTVCKEIILTPAWENCSRTYFFFFLMDILLQQRAIAMQIIKAIILPVDHPPKFIFQSSNYKIFVYIRYSIIDSNYKSIL
jgi:hypothetical protein